MNQMLWRDRDTELERKGDDRVEAYLDYDSVAMVPTLLSFKYPTDPSQVTRWYQVDLRSII